MAPSPKLLDFFRHEFAAEQKSGFALLSRVPDSTVEAKLRYYKSLSDADKTQFIDCSAHAACRFFGLILDQPNFDHTKHPFYQQWVPTFIPWEFRSNHNVPMLRVSASQYKIDQRRGVRSSVSEELFRFAQTVRSIKAPELRKRVRVVLAKFGYQKLDQCGGNRCSYEGQEFEFNADFGSRAAQMRYSVTPFEFRDRLPGQLLCFENALGMGLGWWDYIVEENVDDAFQLLEELIKYAALLPRRIREAVA
jgi:hypothetical protein